MEFLAVLAIGFISSFLGSFTSGGVSIIAFSLLGALGFSPLTALATFKVGVFGGQIGSLYDYVKADKIIWKRVWVFTVLGVVAAYVGTSLVISIDEDVLEKLIGFALLACLPLTLFKPHLGIKAVQTSMFKEYIGHFVYFLNTVYAYTLVVGAGIFSMYSQAYFYGMTLLEIKGTSKIPNLVKGVVSVTVLAGAGFVDWKLGGGFFLGSLVGGFIGTHYSIKVGDIWLRRVLFLTVFAVSIKLILGL